MSANSARNLASFFTAMAAHTENAPDAEIVGDPATRGSDPEAVRSVLLGAVQKFRKQRLLDATEQHRLAVKRLESHAARLPSEAAARRALLGRVVSRRPQMSDGVTLQFRDFASLSDADVESALTQLDALGMLADEPDPDSSP